MRYAVCSGRRILSTLNKSDGKGERCHTVLGSLLPLAEDVNGEFASLKHHACGSVQNWRQAELMTRSPNRHSSSVHR